jgi:hypothetical protein
MTNHGTLRDTAGRGVMVLTALSTLVAFADGLRRIRAASDDRLWIEGWRTFGYVVFAGLFAVLAARPRRSPGIWELTFGHKLAMVIYGAAIGDVFEAVIASRIDLGVVVMITIGWVLCRGWESWRAPR